MSIKAKLNGRQGVLTYSFSYLNPEKLNWVFTCNKTNDIIKSENIIINDLHLDLIKDNLNLLYGYAMQSSFIDFKKIGEIIE